MVQNFLTIGHRGAAGYAPENTLRSFDKALELAVDMIECDVRRCKSGELVVVHDDIVRDVALNELGDIPTLTATIERINHRAALDIEIKDVNIAKDVASMIEQFLVRGWQPTDFLVTSFKVTEIEQFRIHNQSVPVGIIVKRLNSVPIALAKQLNAEAIFIPEIRATKKLINTLHHHNFKVYVYSRLHFYLFNMPFFINRLKRNGVDGICSDKPDLV